MHASPVSQRFHLLLTSRQHELLVDESERSGLAMAELIRRAVDHTYRRDSRARVRGVEISLGVWRRPDAAVAGRRTKTLDGRRY
jgi:hypothetical protein